MASVTLPRLLALLLLCCAAMPRPLNPHAAAWTPFAVEPLSLTDALPADLLALVLSWLGSPEHLGRAACVCRAFRAATGAIKRLCLSIALPLATEAPLPALPSALAGAPWLSAVSSLSLSGVFLAEAEVVLSCSLPSLAQLSVFNCQKLLGEATVVAVVGAASQRRLRSVAIAGCISFAPQAASSLLGACITGACPLRALVLSDLCLHACVADVACDEQRCCTLRLLALITCELSGDLPAMLACAPRLEALFLGGTCSSGGPLLGQGVGASVPTLRILERTRALGNFPPKAPFALCGAAGTPTEWDLCCSDHAVRLAHAGTRRVAAQLARLSVFSCKGGAIQEADLRVALAAACHGARAGSRRGEPLHAAALSGDAAHCGALCLLGARPDSRGPGGATPLFYAAEAGHAHACAALLDAGAQLHVRTAAGEGPLYIAALKGRLHAAQVLLQAATDRRTPQGELSTHDGWLPCHAAAVAGRPHMLALCASHGDLDAPNRFGQTALHIVARKGSADLAYILIAAGAAVGVRDGRGAAPADVAAKHGHAALARRLRALEPQGRRPPGKVFGR